MSGPIPALMTGLSVAAFILLAGHRPEIPGAAVAPPGTVVPGGVVSQGFGCTSFELEPVDDSCPGGHFHFGLDLAAASGTAVLSPLAGIALVGEDGACGTHVVIQHPGGLVTLYCHLSEAVVASGESVLAGQPIGRVGSTGLATGPHLHFEVHAEGRPVDPAAWLRLLPAINPTPSGGN